MLIGNISSFCFKLSEVATAWSSRIHLRTFFLIGKTSMVGSFAFFVETLKLSYFCFVKKSVHKTSVKYGCYYY